MAKSMHLNATAHWNDLEWVCVFQTSLQIKPHNSALVPKNMNDSKENNSKPQVT